MGTERAFSTYSRNSHRLIKSFPTNGFDNIISDSDFTNLDYTLKNVEDFIATFPGNLFKKNQIRHIYSSCKSNRINVIVILAKLETENNLITWGVGENDLFFYRMRWALGCGMYASIERDGKIIKPNAGFETQISLAANKLSSWFYGFQSGDSVLINLNEVRVHPKNGGTYALYKYTPFWGEFEENGAHCSGNERYMIIFNRYKQLMAVLK